MPSQTAWASNDGLLFQSIFETLRHRCIPGHRNVPGQSRAGSIKNHKGASIMERRKVLKTMAIAGLAAGAAGTAATAQTAAQTFVLVHGAWHGGWCWSRVADRLRGAGHRVFTPTQTGLGQREHFLCKDITLDTFTSDIVNVVEAEEL